MKILKASALDCGVKNYQKQRFVVDKIQLKNELVYVLERTTKQSFDISAFAYHNKDNLDFGLIKNELDLTPIGQSFNFFINKNGNVVVDVEMLDKTFFYPDDKDNINVVFCLETKSKILSNEDNKQSSFNYQQLKTLRTCIDTIFSHGIQCNLLELEVPNTIQIVQNLGFDINLMRG